MNIRAPLTRKRFRKQLRQAALPYPPRHVESVKKMLRVNYWLAGYARRAGYGFVRMGRPVLLVSPL